MIFQSFLETRAIRDNDLWGAWARGELDQADLPGNLRAALQLTTAWGCMRAVSEDVATLPVGAFERDGGARRRLVGGDAPAWLFRPNPEFNWLETVEQTMYAVQGEGTAYLRIVRGTSGRRAGEPVELWALSPSRVTWEDGNGGRPQFRIRQRNGSGETVVPWEDMLVVRGPTLPGHRQGLSPVGMFRRTLGLGLAEEEHAFNLFSQSAYPGGVIEVPQAATIEQVRELLREWRKHHQGPSRSHLPGVLTAGAEWKQVSINPEDAQFLASRQFTVQEICRIFRVPPHMVQDLSDATYSNIEQQSLNYVTYSLRPWLSRLEAAFNAILPPGAFLKWNVEGLLRSDLESRTDAYRTAIEHGWMTANEIRALEEMNPIESDHGETYWRPLNTAPADLLAKGAGLGRDEN